VDPVRAAVKRQLADIALLLQHATDVLLVLLELEVDRERAAEEHVRLDPLVLLEHLAPELEVGQLHVEELVPDLADAEVGLLLVAVVIVVDLHQLVEDLPLEHRLARVEQRLVKGDVLLLDLADLGVELPREPIGVLRPLVLVVGVGLLLAGQEGQDVELAQWQRPILLVVLEQPDLRVVVMVLGRTARDDLGLPLDDRVRVLAL
jgi:hypothetical protein